MASENLTGPCCAIDAFARTPMFQDCTGWSYLYIAPAQLLGPLPPGYALNPAQPGFGSVGHYNLDCQAAIMDNQTVVPHVQVVVTGIAVLADLAYSRAANETEGLLVTELAFSNATIAADWAAVGFPSTTAAMAAATPPGCIHVVRTEPHPIDYTECASALPNSPSPVTTGAGRWHAYSNQIHSWFDPTPIGNRTAALTQTVAQKGALSAYAPQGLLAAAGETYATLSVSGTFGKKA